MKRYIRFLVNLCRTIIFNYRLLSFKDAIKLPFWLNQKVIIHGNSGSIKFTVPIKRKMFVFTTIHSEILGEKPSHWNNHGKIVIQGYNIRIGSGTCISCFKNGEIQFGNNITFGGNNKVIAQQKIEVGANLRTAWEVQIIDTNFHYTINSITKEISAKQNPIIIGEDCWLANRASLMKGVNLPDKTIVASNSIVNKQYLVPQEEDSLVVGGCPAKVIGYNISRLRLTGDQEMDLTLKLKQLNLDKIQIEDVNTLKFDY
ncbi:acyltransferase [Lutibacter sp. A64]|uniref:acyltransferase n=1 Tax=Lutibacter sp. A64 TaxID=2918526 RepID=UPI001F06FDD1|nr:acyltransferase [Lutibacter sp. A64]UMB54361.1 acyltransferase [Lutibacter sp. A64]